MDFNISFIRTLIDLDDEFGFKYIEIIQKAINSKRVSKYRYATLKKRSYKEKILISAGLKVENCEAHHIIPKCCGGTDDPENIVILYQTSSNPEHLLAHEYLCKSYSLFPSFHSKLIIAYNYMAELIGKSDKKIKIPEGTGLNKGRKFTKEVIDKRIESCKKAVKILYKGKIYRSARELVRSNVNSIFKSESTILNWARKNKNGLSLVSSDRLEVNPKQNNIKILYKGKIYRSARELSKEKMFDGKIHAKSTILDWARKK